LNSRPFAEVLELRHRSKQPRVILAEGAAAVPAFYDLAVVWSPENQARRSALRAAR